MKSTIQCTTRITLSSFRILSMLTYHLIFSFNKRFMLATNCQNTMKFMWMLGRFNLSRHRNHKILWNKIQFWIRLSTVYFCHQDDFVDFQGYSNNYKKYIFWITSWKQQIFFSSVVMLLDQTWHPESIELPKSEFTWLCYTSIHFSKSLLFLVWKSNHFPLNGILLF